MNMRPIQTCRASRVVTADGQIITVLADEHGTILSALRLDRETAVRLIGQLLNAVDALETADTIGPCWGAA